jgi:prophage regulatory protein
LFSENFHTVGPVQAARNFMETSMDIDPLDKLSTVTTISGISKPYIYLLISKNQFPRPIKVGRASMWLRSEVVAWVSARVIERDSAALKSTSQKKRSPSRPRNSDPSSFGKPEVA